MGDQVEAKFPGIRNETVDGFSPKLRIADHTALAHPVSADLKLRFDERDNLAVRAQECVRGWKKLLEADERRIDDHEVECFWKVASFQMAGVGAFHSYDTLILPKLVVQLPVAYVDREHLRGAALKQAISETTSGCPEISDCLAGRVIPERVERAFELDTAP